MSTSFPGILRRGLLLIWVLGATCGTPVSGLAESPPNVLFLLSDDQRPDTIGALGNENIDTPSLDRLAREGLAFTRAVCSNPICTPSRAEILSGCDGFRSGVRDFGGSFREGLTFWPQAMRDAGYRTVYVGKWHVRGRPSAYGFTAVNGLYSGGGGRWWRDQTDWKGTPITGYRGWVFQSEDGATKYPEKGVGLTPNISNLFADAAIEVIEAKSEQPFFLHVSFTAPHDPLLTPPGYENRYQSHPPLPENFLAQHPFDHGNSFGRDERLTPWPRTPEAIRDILAQYYRVISHMDEAIGRILAALERTGKAENTWVIFSSDHGLAVGSHGLRGKQSMYEHTIGVPLLIRGPGVQGGRTTSAQVYLRELYPTVCDLCGVKIPATVQGKSFVDVVRGKTETAHTAVFGYFRDKQRMIRTDRYKLILYPEASRIQLFDLREDPHELRNLWGVAEYADASSRLYAQLQQWRREAGDPAME